MISGQPSRARNNVPTAVTSSTLARLTTRDGDFSAELFVARKTSFAVFLLPVFSSPPRPPSRPVRANKYTHVGEKEARAVREGGVGRG